MTARKRLVERQALAWLMWADPEYPWTLSDGDLVGAVRDNLRTFGPEDTGYLPRALLEELHL